ncbi:hypothetical protein VNO78_27095 [Psophocarpus tetragonolobus]|uniref:Uncharacterized protein n=1 Tax=Psophocarpus tetragonolobus TaxID=3891 RepID=A0AAN9XBP7_PSOTE
MSLDSTVKTAEGGGERELSCGQFGGDGGSFEATNGHSKKLSCEPSKEPSCEVIDVGACSHEDVQILGVVMGDAPLDVDLHLFSSEDMHWSFSSLLVKRRVVRPTTCFGLAVSYKELDSEMRVVGRATPMATQDQHPLVKVLMDEVDHEFLHVQTALEKHVVHVGLVSFHHVIPYALLLGKIRDS